MDIHILEVAMGEVEALPKLQPEEVDFGNEVV